MSGGSDYTVGFGCGGVLGQRDIFGQRERFKYGGLLVHTRDIELHGSQTKLWKSL